MESIISQVAVSSGIDPTLALAIAYVESGLDPARVRFEPGWTYLVNVEKYARDLGITRATETVLQSMSWGCLQIMGSNARALGYDKLLTLLIEPELGSFYACKHLKALLVKFKVEEDVISAYNQGTPKKVNGVYRNLEYVNRVSARLHTLRTKGT